MRGPEEIGRLQSILDGLGSTQDEDTALLDGKSCNSFYMCSIIALSFRSLPSLLKVLLPVFNINMLNNSHYFCRCQERGDH